MSTVAKCPHRILSAIQDDLPTNRAYKCNPSPEDEFTDEGTKIRVEIGVVSRQCILPALTASLDGDFTRYKGVTSFRANALENLDMHELDPLFGVGDSPFFPVILDNSHCDHAPSYVLNTSQFVCVSVAAAG